ncbi:MULTISPECIES: transposase [Amycolatopsis]|uniref:transposase n=1 Tax=Amycolatopsis TaxID=1813 RepID=UPI000B8A6AA2|nr:MULTISPECIES: transposase [Amycolatopsis]OXM67156.1 hypothetical protein CF166_24975 [Amycolatopsis sp. KNN50.9b]
MVEDLTSRQVRPLDRVYPVVLFDAGEVKICDGAVANRPVCVAVGITLGERDVLGMWAGAGGEGGKGWVNQLPGPGSRAVEGILIVARDWLPDGITALRPRAEVQLCVVHPARASLRYVSKKYWSATTKQLKLIYTASNVKVAEAELAGFSHTNITGKVVVVWKRATNRSAMHNGDRLDVQR